ncbi:MAG TPA: FtsX-like permease family protein [Steroidobacteraceae bacterium]|nr:FtsX-like permease family protein [Steroidobacteraceae bacterium]
MRRAIWVASARHLLRHPAQLALALLGLALGVATITAVDIATASSSRAFELSLAAVDGPATDAIVGGPTGIDERLYVQLAAAHPGLAVVPIVEGYVSVGEEALQLVGIDPLAMRSAPGVVRGGSFADLRDWLTQRGTVMMAASTAERLGLKPAQVFTLDVGGRAYRAVLLRRIEREQAGEETLLLTDIAQAQEWLGLIGRLSRIDLQVAAGAAGAAQLRELARQLPPDVHLESARQRSQTGHDMTRAFTTNLRAMSLLALLVGLFLIYGAVSFAVLQRRNTLAVLRALGATRGEVLRAILAEAAVLGIAGALLGLGAGVALGHGLIALVARTINDLYFVVAVTSVSLPPLTVLKALGGGVLTALAAALIPALEAAHVAPQLGLRRSALEARALGISRWLLLVSAVLALAAGALVLGSTRSLLAGFVALFLLLLSVAALTPALLRLGARIGSRAAGRASPVARVAFGAVGASLSRTGVAVAALGMAVAAMIGVSVMVESFRESLRDWLVRTMRADIYVSAPGPGFARPERRLDPQVVSALLAVPGIRAHSASRRIRVDSPSGSLTLDAVSLPPEGRAGIQLLAADGGRVWSEFEHGALLIAAPLAWSLQLHPGEPLQLATPAGLASFPIAGIYQEYGNDRGAVLIDRGWYARRWGDDAIGSLGLYLSPGARPRQVLKALRAAASGRQALFISSNADVRALSMSIFEQTFVITRVLYWLAAIVAAIGLVSSLLAWELERAHELAVLRSLGLTPRGTAALIETQTAFMGLTALLAALPAGLLTALLLVDVINARAFGWRIDFHLSAAQLRDALVLALAAALVAGLYPAWRSARTPVAADIREE